jgi:hypothetical protein
VTLQLEEEKLVLAIPATQPQSQAQACRTAIQAQLRSLPQVLEAEERAGNQMPGIANY